MQGLNGLFPVDFIRKLNSAFITECVYLKKKKISSVSIAVKKTQPADFTLPKCVKSIVYFSHTGTLIFFYSTTKNTIRRKFQTKYN